MMFCLRRKVCLLSLSIKLCLLAVGCGAQKECDVSAVRKNSIALQPGCWDWAGTNSAALARNLPALLTRERQVTRSGASFWCLDTAKLQGTVKAYYDSSHAEFPDTVMVTWTTISGSTFDYIHRFGKNYIYDVCMQNTTSGGCISTYWFLMEAADIRKTLQQAIVIPDVDNWMMWCNQSMAAFGILDSNLLSGNWVRVRWNEFVIPYYRMGAGNVYDLCLRGCPDWSRLPLRALSNIFAINTSVTTSPDVSLLSDSRMATTPGRITKHPVQIGLLFNLNPLDFSQYTACSEEIYYEDMAYLCLLLSSGLKRVCPVWSSMSTNDVVNAFQPGTPVVYLGTNMTALVVIPPGSAVVRWPFSSTCSQFSMGANGLYQLCLGGCRKFPPQPSFNFTDWENTTYYEQPTQSAASDDCFDLGYAYLISLPFAGVAVLYLAFRTQRKARRLDLWNGFPGLPMPMDFYGGDASRLMIILGWGATTVTISLLLTQTLKLRGTDIDASKMGQRWFTAFLNFVLMLVVGFIYYPIFAGITTKIQPSGSVIGLGFSIAYFVVHTLYLESCTYGTVDTVIGAFSVSPALICFFFLTLFFAKRLILSIVGFSKTGRISSYFEMAASEKADTYEFAYVRKLLRKPPPPQPPPVRPKHMIFIHFLKDNLWAYNSKEPFRYSNVYLSALFVGLIGIYNVFLLFLYAFTSTFDSLDGSFSGKWLELSNALEGCLLTLTVVSFIIMVIQIMHSVGSYKKHMLRLYRGERHFLTAQAPPVAQTLAALRFLGYQIAYSILGYVWLLLILSLVICVIVTFLWAAVYYDGPRDFLVSVVITSAAIATAVLLILRVTAMVFFTHADSTKKSLAIDNTRAFHNVVFFMTFYNVMVGIFSSLVRLAISLIFNVFMLGRLNRPIMPRGWTQFDFGFNSYCNYLRVEVAHSHPCLVTFVAVISKQIRITYRKTTNKKAATRWHLAYTLLRNPCLIPHRSHQLKQTFSIGGGDLSMSASHQFNGDTNKMNEKLIGTQNPAFSRESISDNAMEALKKPLVDHDAMA